MQIAIILVGAGFSNEEQSDKKINISKFFTCASSLTDGDTVCKYPLLSTIILAGFYALLICYVTYVGTQILSLVINKGLRRRIYVLIASVILLLPLRALLLGFSVLPSPGSLLYEASVFLSFLMLLFCTTVGICTLVFCPVSDSLALRDIGHAGIRGMPYDDYYHDGALLIANQSHQRPSRNSNESAKSGSTSFCSINLGGFAASEDISEARFSHGPAIIPSSVS